MNTTDYAPEIAKAPSLMCGDCREVMAAMPADSVDTIITDPPYGLSFMGKGWDQSVPGPDYWRAALRVAKPGALLLAFGGTRTFHRLTCAIEDAGWGVRDCLSWLYGSGFPKSLDLSKAIDKAAGAEREVVGSKLGMPGYSLAPDQGRGVACVAHGDSAKECAVTAPSTDAAKRWHGWGTALKPAWEPIVLAMKPLDGTFAENAQRHGVAGLAIDAGRIGRAAGDRTEYGVSGDEKPGKSVALQSIGRVAYVPDDAGRFPANVLLDEVAAAALDEQSGGASRFFYCAKASRSERGAGNDHPTVKPLALMRYLCRLTKTPTGGVVLDPFAGSGSTGVAAVLEGRPFVGIELDPHNAQIAVGRLAAALGGAE